MINYDKICCLCAKEGDGYKNLLDSKYSKISKVVDNFFHIKIQPNTEFQCICSRCDEKLMNLSEFEKEVVEAQNYLKHLIARNNETEEEYNVVPIDVKVEAIELAEIPVKEEPLDDDKDLKQDFAIDLFNTKESSEDYEKPTQKSKQKSSNDPQKKALLKTSDRDKLINKFFDFTCPKCQIKLVSWQNYKHHISQEHSDTLPLTFTCCNLEMQLERKKLLAHIDYHTNPDDLKCKLCGKQFTTASNMKKHEWRHKNAVQKGTKGKKERKVPCDQCGRVLADKDSFRKHMAIHMTEEEREKLKAQCDYCQKIFRDKNTVLSHIKNTHVLSGETFSCDQCAKVYPTRKAFSDHYKIHHSNKKVTCTECGMEMKACNLGKHKRLKHDHKPQTCPVCFKVIKNRATLMIHRIRYHMGPRFSCEVCGKLFNVKQKCKEHQESHFITNRFSCDQCEYMNNDYANMLKHRKTRHPNATPLVHGTGRQILELK